MMFNDKNTKSINNCKNAHKKCKDRKMKKKMDQTTTDVNQPGRANITKTIKLSN